MSARLDGRNGEVWRRYSIYGWTQERIAEHFNIHQTRVGAIIREVSKGVEPVDKQLMIQKSLELLDDLKARAMEIVDMAAAPVAVGKDGEILRDPENGDAIIRDYSGRIRAMEFAVRADDTIAKRLGLNAPDRVESTSHVKYEIVDVPTEDLT
jgi:regulator of PEP synthase PpsR (kinase-PPPase family)